MSEPFSPPDNIIPEANYKGVTIYVTPDSMDAMLDSAGGSDDQKSAFKKMIVEMQGFEEGEKATTLDEANTLYGFFCDGWRSALKAHGIKEK